MGEYLVTQGNRRLASDEWLTPPWLLGLLGKFDLDPCAATNRPWDTATKNYTVENDGLKQPWNGRVWLNPPFGKGLADWINRLAQHGNGIGIMPLRSTDTNWFHESIWSQAGAVLFLRGRVRFYTVEGKESGPCPHASLMIAYGDNNVQILRSAVKETSRPLINRAKYLSLSEGD